MSRPMRIVLPLCLALLGNAGAGVEGTAAAAGAVAAKRGSARKPVTGRVVRVVFLDLEHCCACTRGRIDDGWKTLTQVLGSPPRVPLDRVHIDTQAAKAAPYRAQRTVTALPAIYFVDRKGELVEVLQGDVTAAEIRKILAGGRG